MQKNKKTLTVTSIKALAKTKNAAGVEGPERFSFYENREHFCIYSLKDGDTVTKDPNGKITAVGGVKLGDEVIAIEEEITTNDNQTVKQYYFLTSVKAEDYVKAEASRNVNARVEMATNLMKAEHAKELAKFDLQAALATTP